MIIGGGEFSCAAPIDDKLGDNEEKALDTTVALDGKGASIDKSPSMEVGRMRAETLGKFKESSKNDGWESGVAEAEGSDDPADKAFM